MIEMKNITKSFGTNVVLKNVSIAVRGGEICALIGENGAGKSTLMNILGGVHQMDSGAIFIDGQRVRFDTPAQSLAPALPSFTRNSISSTTSLSSRTCLSGGS